MAEEPASEIQLLRSQKAKLIEILSGDADFVLQHADSCCLLSPHGYRQVKACLNPSEKVRDLLDHVIQRGPEAARGLLELLNDKDLQETFPKLHFMKDVQVNTLSPGSTKSAQYCQQSHSEVLSDFYVENKHFLYFHGNKERSRQRETALDLKETVPSKNICNSRELRYKAIVL